MKPIEQKILGSMLLLATDNGEVHANKTTIARKAGYKNIGGGICYALDALERDNHIIRLGENQWKVCV